MIIHVIQAGETATSIANFYGISEEWLIRENLIQEPDNLVVGAALVILFPEITYTIVEGDTLEGIASMYNVSV